MTTPSSDPTALRTALVREKIARRLEAKGVAAAVADAAASTVTLTFTTDGQFIASAGSVRAVDTPESLDALASALVEQIPAEQRAPDDGAVLPGQSDAIAAGKAMAAEARRRHDNSLAFR